MSTGEVPEDIPFIKKASMGVLRETFSNRDTALMRIKEGITEFYTTNFPELLKNRSEDINKSVSAIQKAFTLNTFPRMKVTYDVYPDHIGHLESTGCFRCHNDSFKSESGEEIQKDCNLCHTIVGQGSPGKMDFTEIRQSLEFKHPVEIGNAWYEGNCSECHQYLF
jgi:hypothetical protein